MPVLTVLAGPNGAGKSYFSGFFLETGWITTQPVNIDALESYVDPSRIPNDPMRYERCLEEQVNKIFNELCHEAILNERNFSFESNLRLDQLGCVNFFDRANYEINLIMRIKG
jgi:predicted ABC-type ATPase